MDVRLLNKRLALKSADAGEVWIHGIRTVTESLGYSLSDVVDCAFQALRLIRGVASRHIAVENRFDYVAARAVGVAVGV
jgi:hypothetical protein